jgi:hypothetical protein
MSTFSISGSSLLTLPLKTTFGSVSFSGAVEHPAAPRIDVERAVETKNLLLPSFIRPFVFRMNISIRPGGSFRGGLVAAVWFEPLA